MPFSSCLAWFKLSECVIKNEREKAFTAYRLLAYSFLCESFKLQVLADLHASFQDYEIAFELYKQALDLCVNESEMYVLKAQIETVRLLRENTHIGVSLVDRASIFDLPYLSSRAEAC